MVAGFGEAFANFRGVLAFVLDEVDVGDGDGGRAILRGCRISGVFAIPGGVGGGLRGADGHRLIFARFAGLEHEFE